MELLGHEKGGNEDRAVGEESGCASSSVCALQSFEVRPTLRVGISAPVLKVSNRQALPHGLVGGVLEAPFLVQKCCESWENQIGIKYTLSLRDAVARLKNKEQENVCAPRLHLHTRKGIRASGIYH